MFCRNCGAMCNDNELFCKSCGQPLQQQAQVNEQQQQMWQQSQQPVWQQPVMQEQNAQYQYSQPENMQSQYTYAQPKKKRGKKKKIIAAAIAGVVLITAVFRVISFVNRDVYDTDLYGTWEWESLVEGDNGEKYIGSIVFKKDGTVISNTKYYDGDEWNDYGENEGERSKVEKIDKDLIKITLSSGLSGSVVKYKNMLGSYTETYVPDGKTFDLTIQNEDDSDYATVYSENGKVHYCIDYENCYEGDCGGETYKYKRKGNCIQIFVNGKWKKSGFILDNGIFYKQYTKKK